MRQLTVTITGLVVLATMASQAQAYDDGLYFSFGIGYAHVMGDRGVPLQAPGLCPESVTVSGVTSPVMWAEGNACIVVPPPSELMTVDEFNESIQARYDEIVRTEGGSMLGIQLRLGYNFFGYASVEGALSGAGSGSFTDGSVHVGAQLRVHPAQFLIPHADRDWDVSLFAGAGYSLAGYKPQYDPQVHGGSESIPEINRDAAFDGKGWEGIHASFGVGFDYQFGELVSVGLDLKIIRPLYATWVANFEEPYETLPVSTPETWIVTPTVRVTVHLFSPGG
ncbi:MAG: hypothetical protein QF464_04215 [Myxococcota bacterium]|nr:hypothetical protein [Myxococcota bacterium]